MSSLCWCDLCWNFSRSILDLDEVDALQILSLTKRLSKLGMLDCIDLLHFHVGSQIPDILILKDVMREATHIFADLKLLGAKLSYFDVGGTNMLSEGGRERRLRFCVEMLCST